MTCWHLCRAFMFPAVQRWNHVNYVGLRNSLFQQNNATKPPGATPHPPSNSLSEVHVSVSVSANCSNHSDLKTSAAKHDRLQIIACARACLCVWSQRWALPPSAWWGPWRRTRGWQLRGRAPCGFYVGTRRGTCRPPLSPGSRRTQTGKKKEPLSSSHCIMCTFKWLTWFSQDYLKSHYDSLCNLWVCARACILCTWLSRPKKTIIMKKRAAHRGEKGIMLTARG